MKTSTSARSRSSSAPSPRPRASTTTAPARSGPRSARERPRQPIRKANLMAEVCTLDWHIVPFRSDRFLDHCEPIAAKAPAYGAKSWSLIRAIDDPQSFRQTIVWESRSDFERYWYAEEIAEARASIIDLYDIPLLPACHTLVAAE